MADRAPGSPPNVTDDDDAAILPLRCLDGFASYFSERVSEEIEIRELAGALPAWCGLAMGFENGTTVCHGWKPRVGLSSCRWDTGYNEVLGPYALVFGLTDVSCRHPRGQQGMDLNF